MPRMVYFSICRSVCKPLLPGFSPGVLSSLVRSRRHKIHDFAGTLLSRHFPGGHTPCSRSFDFQGSVPVDKNYLTEKNSLLPYMQEVGKIRKTAIFPRFWKCVIMDDKSRIYPEERGHLYVHKTIAAGTAERFTGSR